MNFSFNRQNSRDQPYSSNSYNGYDNYNNNGYNSYDTYNTNNGNIPGESSSSSSSSSLQGRNTDNVFVDSDSVIVRSNTIVGDRSHNRGMVVAKIVKGNIPVINGVVHLIDKPLMIVARSLYEYIMEEGRQPGNRLSSFAALLRDKGGAFAEALLEAKDGTFLAPSNEAMANVDQNRLDFILGNDYLRAEMLGLHLVRERVISTDYKIKAGGDKTFSSPASLPANRIWFHYSDRDSRMTVEGRGINATVVEKDIGTINGVIHIVDKMLGVPYQTVGERIQSDPNMRFVRSQTFTLDKTNAIDKYLGCV